LCLLLHDVFLMYLLKLPICKKGFMDQEEGRKLFVPSNIHRNRIYSLPLPVQRKGREELQEEGIDGLIYTTLNGGIL
jgi:hypothetical protein